MPSAVPAGTARPRPEVVNEEIRNIAIVTDFLYLPLPTSINYIYQASA